MAPQQRLSDSQLQLIDAMSRELLEDPGLFSYSAEAVDLFRAAGARIEDGGPCPRIRLPGRLVDSYSDVDAHRACTGVYQGSHLVHRNL